MSTITTRSGKGSPLTNNEVDANFTNLNNDKLESADLSGYAELTGATFTGEVEATGFNGDLTGAILFKGQAGEALTKGDPVYISGISGNKTVVSKADANDSSKMPCFGIVDATVSANADCSVVTFGTLQGLDTSSFSEGDELFVSDTGALTTTAPTGESSQIQKIGKVTRSHASAGSIKVMGAGRTNATPNLNDGQFFLGNGSNQAVSADFATSVLGEISAGTGIGISASGVISNTDPDQTVSLTGGTGISTSGAYPNFTITNDSPDQTVSLTGAGATSISGTYPNFTISSTDSNTTYTAGTGITLSGTTFSLTDTNAKLNLTGGTLTGALSGTTATFSGSVTAATADINGGASYPLQVSSTQRYQIQVRNPNNTTNGGYGWWLAHDTDFDFAIHADGAGDRLTLSRSGNLDVYASLSVGGTTVIDASRNLTNINAITSTGVAALTRGNGSVGAPNTANHDTGTRIELYNTSATSWYAIGIESNTMWFNSDSHYRFYTDAVSKVDFDGNGVVNAVGGYKVNGTTVIDSSRNLTNLGTIAASGQVTVLGTDVSLLAQKNVSTGWSGRIISSNATTGVASFLGNYNGYAGVFAHNSSLSAWAPIYINTHSSTGAGAANVYLGTTYINGNTAWHAGNDGSGSGLDADLLDGQHGSYYMPASTTTIAQSNYVSGSGFSTNGPDSVLEYAQWSSQTDTKFAPSTDWYNSIRMGHGDPYSYYSNTMAMKMTGTGSGTLYTQVISNNSAGGWNKYWHTNNDGSGSGLDADLLDGQHGSYYAPASHVHSYLPLAGGTITGNLNVNGTTTLGNGNADQTHINDTLYLGATDSGDSHFYFGENSSNWYGDHWYWDSGYEVERYSRYAGTDTLIEKHDTRYTHKVQTNRAYERLSHSTGYQIGSYNSVGGNSAKTNPIYTIGDSYRPSDTSIAGMYGIGYAHSNLWGTGSGKTSGWGQYVAEAGAYTQIFSVGGTWSLGEYNRNGNKVWDAGNDGSGSGLDADLLDGQHGSYYYSSANPPPTYAKYLRSDTTDNFTGSRLQFPTLGLSITNDNSGGGYSHYIRGTSTHIVIGTTNGNTYYQNYGNTSGSYNLSGNVTHNGSNAGTKLWGISNDGSGSGLDADLLDGQHASAFLGVNATAAEASSLDVPDTRNSGARAPNDYADHKVTAEFTDDINGAWWSSLTVKGWHDGYAPWQLVGYSSTAQSEDFYVRFGHGSNNTWTGLRKIWHSGNDGSGSGLDADLLDGQQGSSYLRSNADDTCTGMLTLQRSGNTSYSTPNIFSKATSSSGGVANYHARFNRPDGTSNGHISTNYYATTYATTSDYRVKEDLQPMLNATSRLMALNPINFQWKDSDIRTDGFLAHEVAEVVSDAVVGEKDAVDENGSDQLQALDQAKLVPLLVKTIQEQQAAIEALEARIANLES